MGAMHDEEEELALNAKAIGLAIGGAIVAGLLFVLARRDDEKSVVARVEGTAETAVDDLKQSGKEAKKKQKALRKAAEKQAREAADQAKELIAYAEADARNAERDMKAAAWDALQEAQEAEGRIRSASSRVAGDAAHLASKLTHEAKSLAEEGRDRIGHLRHREGTDFSAQDEIARLREELEHLRERTSGGRAARRELSALTAKITKSSGLDPNSVAADALAAGLDHLERSLKAKAPELLATKDRRQISSLLQSELGPVLRDSLLQAATTALSSWEAARAAVPELPKSQAQTLKAAVSDAPRQMAKVLHRADFVKNEEPEGISRVADDISAKAEAAASEAEARVRHVRDGIEANTAPAEVEAGSESTQEHGKLEDEHHGKSGLLWGAAALGLGIYALADHERREQFLKMANEASVLAQELLRDLQGYDDEFA